jgi:rRNA maturation protein Nop10
MKYRRYGLQTTCDNDGDCPRPSAIPTQFSLADICILFRFEICEHTAIMKFAVLF